MPLTDPRRSPIASISGQGGAGKTTLLRRLRAISDNADAVTTWADENDSDVLQTIHALATSGDVGDFDQVGKTYERYLEQRHALLSSPDAPSGLPAVLAQGIGRGVVALGRQVPVVGAAFDLVEPEAGGNATTEALAFVSRHLKKDDADLVHRPVEALTRDFVAALGRIARRQHIVLFIDTYEETAHFVEPWLLRMLSGGFGDLPAAMTFVIAGRHQLSPDAWAPFESAIERLELGPLSDEEVRELVRSYGIADTESTNLVRASHGLPLMATMLASTKHASSEGELSPAEIVERFLRGISDRKLRELALAGAFPRLLNEDRLRVVVPELEAQDLQWLIQRPFVRAARDGWKYHATVRSLILAAEHSRSPDEWGRRHAALALAYEAMASASLSADVNKAEDFRLESIYHALASASAGSFELALHPLVAAFQSWNDDGARRIAHVIRAAGMDSGDSWLERIGTLAVQAADEFEWGRYRPATRLLNELLRQEPAQSSARLRIALLQALAALTRADWRFDESREYIDIAIAESEPDADLHEARAFLSYELGDYPGATADLDIAETLLDPDEVGGSSLPVLRARVVLALHGPRDALRELERVSSDSRYAGWAALTEGQALRDMAEFDSAIAAFDRARDLVAAYQHEASKEIGMAHLSAGRAAEAVEALTQSLTAHPGCSHCWGVLAVAVNEELGLESEDLAQRMRATLPNTDHPRVLAAIGVGLESAGWFVEALTIYQAALEIDPHDPETLWNTADVLYKLDRPEEASEALERAFEIGYRSAPAYVLRGRLADTLERDEDAATAFLAATHIDPRAGEVVAPELGLVLSRLGRYDDAILWLDKAGDDSYNLYNAAVAATLADHPDAAERAQRARASLAGEEERVREYGEAGLAAASGEDEAARTYLNRLRVEETEEALWSLRDPAFGHLHDAAD
jgi:hypothetical protein